MKKIFFAIAVLALAPCSRGHAQSFICAKAATPAERLICATPYLVALDVTMTNLYKDVLRRNPALSEDTSKANKLHGGGGGKRATLTKRVSQPPKRIALPS